MCSGPLRLCSLSDSEPELVGERCTGLPPEPAAQCCRTAAFTLSASDVLTFAPPTVRVAPQAIGGHAGK